MFEGTLLGLLPRPLAGSTCRRRLAPEARRPRPQPRPLPQRTPGGRAPCCCKLGDATAAEARLLAEPGRIDGNAYGSLVPLAKALRNHDCPRGETVIYRALLKGILERAYARAYGHAARYWARLREIANGGTGLAAPVVAR
jgi:hypothetical protein